MSWEAVRRRGERLLARVGAAAIGGLVLSQYVVYSRSRKERIPDGSVLHLDMSLPLVEIPPPPLSSLTSPRQPLMLKNVVDAIHKAAKDKRVRPFYSRSPHASDMARNPHIQIKGIVCTFGTDNLHSLATIQEVRQAIERFRSIQKEQPESSRKFTCVTTDTFGEGAQGTSQYYFASAFDKIYIQVSPGTWWKACDDWGQPSGSVGLVGLSMPTFFLKNLLSKLGVEVQFFKFFEYKNAPNVFTEEGYTRPHREQTEKLVESMFDQIVSGIAAQRRLPLSAVSKAVNESPLSAQDAQAHGLVDGILYTDQVLDMLEAKSIVTAAIRAAYKDESVKARLTLLEAIVVRIDSPGGSAVASDTIRRELEKARESGKPVVASMGTYAASGGYYIATAADKITALPGTITGSIGAFYGKFIIGKLCSQIGVSYDESVKAEKLGRRVYEDFVALVAKARNLSLEEVDKVARGRVWTGAQAKELALVDALGGLKVAHELAGELAGLKDETLPPLVEYPKAKSSLEKIILALSGGESEGLSQEAPKSSILSFDNFMSLIGQSDVAFALGSLAGSIFLSLLQ
ncbi:hypothetical protein GUITHDRAFT_131523 [Guillardia theta CCMP2712]|uniref:Peptidase S49 domain-containing protein n=1 Tax=Guillardia theta (strain CCMP2712) TaxID=905079 RepID=L1K4M5_GUITC|nr:hypothetical protein GUITHDRAFT_131523 [Guillardia theta CCMP2712]EKX55283.1 hypothetical protein GUITHDRAFT_131523 [Guillardia theta CCMP2712]|eukprot:XP_005842263.1 hypothetical protein GUITHDRAFT_131523 [Guillardia theta CCMP2712]